MQRKIELRIAGDQDILLVSDFTAYTFKESWLEEGNEADLYVYMEENFNVQKIKHELSVAEISYLLIEVNGDLAAYCKLERDVQPDGLRLRSPVSIGRLYVKRAYQYLGLGSALIDEALLIAAKENYKNIWLGVWHKNPDAIRLYERFGFRKIGEYKFIMGNEISDDYIMQRPV